MKFSIIVAHYQEGDSDKQLQRLLDTLKKQVFTDFEVIVINDGQWQVTPQVDSEGLNISFKNTFKRHNLWGHPSRQLGMQFAQGEWILHTNSDNTYYATALWEINRAIETFPLAKAICCAVKMMGMENRVRPDGDLDIWYSNPRDYTKWTVIKGIPKPQACDVMSLCVKKEAWDLVGGWYDFDRDSDGVIYDNICRQVPWILKDIIIGEHY
jgi:glycosyltransferase involved in cell wall biosynthesis